VLSRANGHTEIADWALAESRRYELLEVAAFRGFDRIYVCSEADRVSLLPRSRAELVVRPNVARVPEPPVPTPRRDPAEPFRFLFIGAMDYYPNSDGYHWFCREVLPILRRIAPGPFGVDVAGAGSDGRLRRHSLVRQWGAVPDVRPLYGTRRSFLCARAAVRGSKFSKRLATSDPWSPPRSEPREFLRLRASTFCWAILRKSSRHAVRILSGIRIWRAIWPGTRSVW